MDLLMGRVNLYIIRLVGRCKGDTMLIYLHTMAKSFMAGLSIHMFQCCNFTLISPVHTGIQC